MTTKIIPLEKREFLDAHKRIPKGMMFYTSLPEIRADHALLPYLHLLLRAWNDLELDGVLCLDGLPTLYLTIRKERVSGEKAAELQRLFWNQGLASVLVIADPVSVQIYSGMARPTNPQSAKIEAVSLVETLDHAEYSLNIQSFMLRLATGSYYQEHAKIFNPEATVDSYLLKNLSVLRDRLKEHGLSIKMAHTFLARILFVCYLCDREIINLGDYKFCKCTSGTKFGDMLAGLKNADEKRHAICDLFNQLKEDFNGSMFEQSSIAECRQLSAASLDYLCNFLQGHEDKQLTLGFWAYDFSWIPVETISAVYEDFLKKEDEPEKRKKGAYYTPRFLAETVVDLALRDDTNLEGKRFLDPSCGSGIFLVTLFNRLASGWLSNHPNSTYSRKADALKTILKDQLCGIDVNPTACRIACFSLYLAYLDCFDPPQIKEYVKRKGKLPSILQYRDSSNEEDPTFPVIYENNFLKPDRLLPKNFDYVVGNPPWSGRGEDGMHHLFAKEIPKYLKNEGTACVLLPSKIFLNDKTNKFQTEWLKAVTLDEVVQLADYRKILFKEAKCPCMIVRFQTTKPDFMSASIEYVVPKTTRIDYRGGIIPVAPGDRKEIPLRQVLSAAEEGVAPTIWKQYLWGTPRDIKFLEMLKQMPKLEDLTGFPEDNKRWVRGQGFQPDSKGTSPTPKKRLWSNSMQFIKANKEFPSLLLLQEDCSEIGNRFPILHRPRDPKIYKPPLVLVSQGIGADDLPKVAYSDFPVVFQDSLQSISGPTEDEDLLLFLTVYLRSKLAKYFLFHTSANWGTERDKVHFTELLRIPFPLPGSEYVHPDAKKIMKEVSSRLHSVKREIEAESKDQNNIGFHESLCEERKRRMVELQKGFEPLIYQYFDLIEQEILLIEDTVDVVIPSSTPGNIFEEIPSLAPVYKNNVERYAEGLSPYAGTLSRTLNEWAEGTKSKIRVSVSGGVHKKTDMACIKIELAGHEQPFREETPSDEAIYKVCNLVKTTSSRFGRLEYLRGVIVFDGSCIYIFKPTSLIGWTRTAALNDAAEIYARIAQARSTQQGGMF